MPLDKSEPSTLLELEVHSRKNYHYLYFCPQCNRSYWAHEQEECCKFCTGPIKIASEKKRYIYFCESCETRIESNDPKMACSSCGKLMRTLYRWDMLNINEKRRIKIARFMHSIMQRMPNVEYKKENKIIKKSIFHEIVKPSKKIHKMWDEELPSDEM